MPLEAADKTIICSAGQASIIGWCWSLRNSLMGLYWRIWLTYTGCQMICIWPKVEFKNCTFIVTMSVQCGYFTSSYFMKVLLVQIFLYLSHASLVWVFVLHFALSPLCIHGNRCPNGSATGNVNNVKSYIMMTRSLEGSNINVCLIFFPKRIQIHLWLNPLLFFSEDPSVRKSHFETLWHW